MQHTYKKMCEKKSMIQKVMNSINFCIFYKTAIDLLIWYGSFLIYPWEKFLLEFNVRKNLVCVPKNKLHSFLSDNVNYIIYNVPLLALAAKKLSAKSNSQLH